MRGPNALNKQTEVVTQVDQSFSVNSSNLVKIDATQGGDDDRSSVKSQEEAILVGDPVQKASYAEVVGRRQVSRMKLTYIPPEEVNGKAVVKYQSLDVMPGIRKWTSAAYGYVMGIHPSFGAIENFARTRYGEFGFEKCFKLSSGLYLFQFDTDEHRDMMLAAGPWIFVRFPMVVKAWTPESCLEKRGEEAIPVWVRIPFLSLQFWNEEMFSKIGSYIGVSLFADGATSECARLYVEVSANRALPQEVPLVNEYGVEFVQKVEYEWVPPCCSHCKLFGHDI